MSIRLMTRVWDETRFGGTELLVLLCLADHANDDGICWPSYDRLAKRARCSRRQVIRLVDRLEVEGWIVKAGRRPLEKGGFVNMFRVVVPKNRGDTDDTSECPFGERGDTHDQTEVTFNANRGDIAVSPKPSGTTKEPSIACSIEQASGFPSFDDVLKYGIEVSSLPSSHIETVAEKWLGSLDLRKIGEWRVSFSAFLGKYERDYRHE